MKLQIEIDPDIKALLRPLSDEERSALRDKLQAEGCTEPLPYAVVGGENVQLDGHHRREICDADEIGYKWRKVEHVTTKEESLAWVRQHQIGRRNLSAEDLAQLRDQRRGRVAAARQTGQSTRSIAEAEGVSQGTVLKDLKAQVITGNHLTGDQAKVRGKDGKSYAKPTAGKRAKKPRKEGFDLKGWQGHFGCVVRGVDDLVVLCGEGRKKLADRLLQAIDRLDEANVSVKYAMKQLKGKA